MGALQTPSSLRIRGQSKLRFPSAFLRYYSHVFFALPRAGPPPRPGWHGTDVRAVRAGAGWLRAAGGAVSGGADVLSRLRGLRPDATAGGSALPPAGGILLGPRGHRLG